ncbi:hypothetical protein BGW38_001243 [Lunasporangiospora selenospora]|uniref:protein-tyrosine-phosphatase n=1 Tax=Lunasporangiospora selenospora TaxID=979761 RepID=A0A9P6FUK4_9FUNG|nr:hypothetical protein BGW38_001243 [Lunasporangiospora selenospora]
MISASSTPNTTPSSSPTETSSSHLLISSPRVSELTPFPASALSPAKLASLIERVQYQKKGMGPSGSKPLILDLRMNSDADPMTIVYSININLPTLLMRRYRRGGAVTSFALESFITIPSDKDLYHLIQDEWRQEQEQSSEPIVHDVVVLDQDMRSGKEEYGRSASSAWTLVSVLERGGGNCGGPIRLWYLDGGFDSFQAWDASGKYLARLGSDIGIDSEIPEQGEPPKLDLLDMPVVRRQEDDAVHPFSAPLTLPSQSTANGTLSNTIPLDDKTTQAIDHAVSLTNASLGGTPRRSAPARRESLFSLNTKSLQRPPGLSRAQTIGVSAINVKPLSVPTLNTSTSLQPLHEGGGNGVAPPLPPLRHKESWLTVPGAPVVSSPAQSLASMSLGNNSMEIANSASTDYTGSQWSVHGGHGGFTYGDNNISPDQQHHGAGAVGLSGRKSFSSTTTLNSMHYSGVASGIQEEDEGHPTSLGRGRSDSGLNGTFFNNPSYLRRHHSSGAAGQMPPPTPTFGEGFQQQFMEAGPFGSSNHGGFSPEYSYPRMFQDGINSNYNSGAVAYGNGQVGGYDDALMEEGADEGEQEISCILPNFLYLGPEIVTKEQVQELERLGVKRVLNMARECEDALVANEPGWEYHKIGVQDYVEADVSAGLLQAVDIIASSPESAIYVHCKAGKSRSVTATIAYLITHLHKAYNHVLAQRPCMCPNIGFVTELMRMEEKILGTERAGGLVRAGSLNSIMSLSTASMTGQGEGNDKHQRHHHHLSLQHHHSPSLSVGTMASATAATSPTLVKSGGLTAKSSMSSLVMLTASSSPPPPTPHPLQPF